MNLWDLCPGPQHPPSRSVCDGLQRLETRALGTELKTSLWLSMGRLKRSFGRDPAAETQTHLEKLVLLFLFYKINLLHSFVFPYLKTKQTCKPFSFRWSTFIYWNANRTQDIQCMVFKRPKGGHLPERPLRPRVGQPGSQICLYLTKNFAQGTSLQLSLPSQNF